MVYKFMKTFEGIIWEHRLKTLFFTQTLNNFLKKVIMSEKNTATRIFIPSMLIAKQNEILLVNFSW